MRKLFVPALAALAALALPAQGHAIGQCGLPSKQPLWADFGVPELGDVFGRPGVIVSGSSGDFPARMRAAGAKTVYWDMNLNKRVGTPTVPADPALIVDRANRLFDFAATQTACEKPLIVLNELFGAQLETPWSVTNQRYRANVMTLLRTLAERGARPFLLLSSVPYAGTEHAAAWWREAAQYSDLVPEVYFNGKEIFRLGPIVGSRRLRVRMRQGVQNLLDLGIPSSRVGVILGFQTSRGFGGREGLEPDAAWYRVVKWHALAARQVARETRIASIWSWGWGSYRPNEHDRDKSAAACVYLWARDARLCNGPRAAGRQFEASLTEGQIRLPATRLCAFDGRTIEARTAATLQAVTADRDVVLTALLARAVESRYASVSTKRVLAAERAVIAVRFGGSRAAYLAALAKARASQLIARGVLADELRRLDLESDFPGRRPSAGEVSAFYFAYPELQVRAVTAKPAPWWLGGQKRGLALAAVAPERLFTLPTRAKATLQALDGNYAVLPLDDARPLGSIPLEAARPAIVTALRVFARRASFESWTANRQQSALQRAFCQRDELPHPGAIRLSGYLPFLALS